MGPFNAAFILNELSLRVKRCGDTPMSYMDRLSLLPQLFLVDVTRYGDRIPRTPFGRLLCLSWILLGLVMLTCFNSTMTTLLTARILNKDVSLYGTKVSYVGKRFCVANPHLLLSLILRG